MSSKSLQNILLLDDEPSVLFALKLLMQAIGYNVNDFLVPADALEFIKTDRNVQLFISDLRMPKLDGLAVLTEVRRLRPDLPFVLMSAHAGVEERERAKALGVAGFLAKPFTPEELHAIVHNIELAQAS